MLTASKGAIIDKSIGHYEVSSLLGKGGMGEVYRARDGKLGREVALKLLPEEVSRDPERVARFEREAKVLASLNHPSIAALYGLEETDGRVFLTMELAEGEDLSHRLQRGAIPIDEALELARQIAGGLEAAHARGIVHRDLKPANVMVSEDGRIKLLDFGLARAYQADEASGDPTTSPTITAAMTQQGVILGTAAYMSPEQARGKSVDKQTDVWAFGVLLYEMLTGARLFDGETISDSIGAVLNKDPDWGLLPAGTSTQIRRLLRRCLQRDRALRLRDIGDALIELRDDIPDATAAAPAAATGRRAGRMLPWMVASVALVAAAAIFLARGGGGEPLPVRKLTITPISERGNMSECIPSPDGTRVAYRYNETVWIRSLDQTTPRRVAEASGFGSWLIMWSPDSRWIAFVNDAKLWKVATDGSAPTQICNIPNEYRSIGGAWDVRDRIILAQWRGGLLEVSANGGTIRELMKAPDDLIDYHSLSLLPDGLTILAAAHLIGESSRVDLIRDGKIIRSLTISEGFAVNTSYSPSGHVVFSVARKGVWAVPFSVDKLELTGEPFVIDSNGSDPCAARDGSLVYSKGVSRFRGQLVRVDMSGRVTGTIGEPADGMWRPLLSPSGSTLAYSMDENGEDKMWTLDLETGVTRRVTKLAGSEWACCWSRDGHRLLMGRNIESNWAAPENGLYMVDFDKGGEPVRVSDGRSGQLLPNAGGILYWRFSVRNEDRLEWKTFESDAQPTPFTASMKRATDPAMSPDGRVVAFESDDSGTIEVYASQFPGGEGTVQLSQGGGTNAVWSRDGRYLYFQHSSSIYRIRVTEGDRVQYGAPEVLFDGSSDELAPGRRFDVLPDGSGFVMVKRLPLEDAAVIYVQNWFSEFERQR